MQIHWRYDESEISPMMTENRWEYHGSVGRTVFISIPHIQATIGEGLAVNGVFPLPLSLVLGVIIYLRESILYSPHFLCRYILCNILGSSLP